LKQNTTKTLEIRSNQVEPIIFFQFLVILIKVIPQRNSGNGIRQT